MAICIFCPNVLSKTTKPEHILHNALGGKRTTRRVICSDCNNRFGGTIDKAFVEQFADIRNMLQIGSGTGGPPPKVRRRKAGADTVTLNHDGSIRLLKKPFTITEMPTGAKSLAIFSHSVEEIEANIPHMAAALGITEDRLRETLSDLPIEVEEKRISPMNFNISFGGPDSFRSVTKSCLVLWATVVGNEELRSTSYADSVNFVSEGDGAFLLRSTNLDSRTIDLQQDAPKFGPAFSMIYVKSDNVGRVIGHFTALNLMGFSVVLAEEGGSPNRQIALINNPLTGEWSDQIAARLDIPFDWFAAPDYDGDTMERTKLRFHTIMEHYYKTGLDRELGRIIRDTIESHDIKEGDLLTADVLNAIGSRVAHHALGLPVKMAVPPDKVRQAFGPKPGKAE